MNAIWNLPTLERPPYATWQIGPQDAKKKGVDITRFKTILTTAIHDLELNDLDENAAVLSRLIYRMKSKFRNDKGLGHMIKLNNALLRYHNMSLKKEYTTLRSDLRTEDGMYVLPSRQILEYVLVRTQGFAKLMARTEEIARCASHFLRGRMKLGHAWSVALVAYATTSRIWFHARCVIRKCCKMYDELYRCAEQFQYVGAKPWLPTDQSLPRNLRSWLGLLWIDPMKLRQTWQTFQRILGEIECDNTKTTFIIPNDEETDGSRLTQVDIASTNNVLEDKPISNNDIGEVVDREAFEKSLPPSDRSIKTKRKHTGTDEGKPKRTKKKE